MRKLAFISAAMTIFTMSALLQAADSTASTPAATMSAFNKAMDDGDTATLAKLSTGDADEQAWLTAYGSHLKAFAGLESALLKRFGKDYAQEDAGVSIGEQIESAKDDALAKDLKLANLVKLNADTVMIEFIEGASPDTQGKLVKVDGQWKLSIESLNNYFSVDDTLGVKARADAANGLAKDVTDGKFATLDDAAEAVAERLTAALGVGSKAIQGPIGEKSLVKMNR